jgi:hypothetical protein
MRRVALVVMSDLLYVEMRSAWRRFLETVAQRTATPFSLFHASGEVTIVLRHHAFADLYPGGRSESRGHEPTPRLPIPGTTGDDMP